MKMKNFLVYLLVTVLIVSLCVPVTAEASELQENDVWIDIDDDGLMELGEVNALNLVSYAFSSSGVWFEEGFEALVEATESFQSFISSSADTVLGWLEDGLVFLSDDMWNFADSLSADLLSDEGVSIYPAQESSKMYYYNLLGRNYSESSLNAILSDPYFATGTPVFYTNNYCFTSVSSTYFDVFNSGSTYFVKDSYDIRLYKYDGTFSSLNVGSSRAYYFSSSSYTSYNYSNSASSYSIAPYGSFLGLVGSSCRVYDSLSVLYNYISYDWGSYHSTNSHGGGGGSIPLSSLNKTDWGNLNNTTHDSIRDDLTSQDSLTDSEAQAIIDAYTDEVLDAIGSIQEGQVTTNQNLEEILNQLTQDGERQSSWLSKIYSLLQEYLPLIGTGGSSGSGASSDQLEEIINLLEKNVDTLEDIEKDTSDIKTLLAIDTTTNFFDLLSSKLGESTDTLKTKFPTSIPWDVMAVVGFMAEDPEPPVYDIPIRVNSLGVEENIHIDLSENSKTSNFSSISKISRSMLTVTFIVYLMVFTRNFTRKDD